MFGIYYLLADQGDRIVLLKRSIVYINLNNNTTSQ